MANVILQLDRWKCHEVSTWPFQRFKRYSLELGKNLQAHIAASKKVFKVLGEEGATSVDDCTSFFQFSPPKKANIYSDINDWSKAYNGFDNWVNLSSIVSSTSNLEIYIATVIQLALESDPGLFFGKSRIIDGAYLLKYLGYEKFQFGHEVVNCIKGDWQSRAAAFEKIFKKVPQKITDNIGELEVIRNLRNQFGHAIGRDIEDARVHGAKEILPITKLSRTRANKYHTLLRSVAKSIDVQLLGDHIGEYQIIHFYHYLVPRLRMDIHPSERAMIYKKKVGRFGAVRPSKQLCKSVVAYYEAL